MEVAVKDKKLILIHNLLDENKKIFLRMYKNLIEYKNNNEYLEEVFNSYLDHYNDYNFKIESKIQVLENLLEYLNLLKNEEDLELNKKKNIKKDIENIKLNISILKEQLLSL